MKIIKSRKKQIAVLILSAIMVNIVDFLMLQLISTYSILSLHIGYAVINMAIMIAVMGIIFGLCGKLWISEAFCSIVCAIYAIVNHYVVEFHGSPLTIPEFQNIKTAVNVMSNYSLLVSRPMILNAAAVFLLAVSAFLVNIAKKNEFGVWGKNAISVRCATFLIGGGILTGIILNIPSLCEPFDGEWHFKATVGKYGYPLYFLSSGLDLKYDVTAPEEYSEEILTSIWNDEYLTKNEGREMPDIFLILNETFYDISLVSDIETDIDYMGGFYDRDNTVSGHIVVPQIGGGTNNSEFELLTSNSTFLLQGITPFAALDMSYTASIVSNLQELGYYAIGMHPASKTNYNRSKGYSMLGFDEIHFDEDFEEKEYYGNRKLVTDECSYNYMIEWYEIAKQQSEQPIFSYLLTIQNHGDWDTNSADLDIVHIQGSEFAGYENKLNEYLSCVSLSVNAFDRLIEYFQDSERPVIICMVGDHAPSFIADISKESDRNALLQRMVPFCIWANFSIEKKTDVVYSMNELVPVLLDIADVEMLPYYQYILKLGENVPIITSYGSYVDAAGNVFSYNDDTEYGSAIYHYFCLEYNNLQEVSLNEWFQLQMSDDYGEYEQ